MTTVLSPDSPSTDLAKVEELPNIQWTPEQLGKEVAAKFKASDLALRTSSTWGKKSVISYWEAGRVIFTAKQILLDGEYTPWLEKYGIARTSAHMAWCLYKRVGEDRSRLSEFTTITEANKYFGIRGEPKAKPPAITSPSALESANALEVLGGVKVALHRVANNLEKIAPFSTPTEAEAVQYRDLIAEVEAAIASIRAKLPQPKPTAVAA